MFTQLGALHDVRGVAPAGCGLALVVFVRHRGDEVVWRRPRVAPPWPRHAQVRKVRLGESRLCCPAWKRKAGSPVDSLLSIRPTGFTPRFENEQTNGQTLFQILLVFVCLVLLCCSLRNCAQSPWLNTKMQCPRKILSPGRDVAPQSWLTASPMVTVQQFG